MANSAEVAGLIREGYDVMNLNERIKLSTFNHCFETYIMILLL